MAGLEARHQSGRAMSTAEREPGLWFPWEHHYYVVCTCGYREDNESKWEIYPLWAQHITQDWRRIDELEDFARSISADPILGHG